MSYGGTAVRDRLPSDRDEFENAFDSAVRDNRFVIAVLFPAVGAFTLVASAEGVLPDPVSFNPWLLLLGVVVMRSPLIAGVLPTVGRRAAYGVSALVVYTYAVEVVGVSTGFPYGEFAYGVSLALPVFYIPLVVNAYLLCLLLLGGRASSLLVRVGVVAVTVVGMDVVLDPGAVALGFWSFEEAFSYGVPLSNYAGWTLSAVVSVVLLDISFDRDALLSRLEGCDFMLDDMVSFVILWGGVNLWFGNLLPALVAVVFGVGLFRTDRFDSRLLDPLS